MAKPASGAGDIPLYRDLAHSPFRLSTANKQARQWFSQGLLFTYGFNHAGAVASFRKAQSLDPDCAMCRWGEALVQTPLNGWALYGPARAEAAAGNRAAAAAATAAFEKAWAGDHSTLRVERL